MTRSPGRAIARWLLPSVLLLIFGVVASSGVAAQQSPPRAQQPTTFRATTELVQVDVVVLDKDGNPIRDLKAEDFTLLDRKKRQTVAAFDEVSHERVADLSGPGLPPTLKLDVASNRSAQSDRLVILVVDDLHLFQGRTDKAKELSRQIVTELGPQASMAVLFTSGDRSTQVTQDRSWLLAAIDTLKGRKGLRRPTAAIDERGVAGGIRPEMSADEAITKLQTANAMSLQDFSDNMTVFKTLQDAARMLGADDGRRKAFVWLSESMDKDVSGLFDAMSPQPDAPTGGAEYAQSGDAAATIVPPVTAYHAWAILNMMDSMRRSNVATFAIDPRGAIPVSAFLRECSPAPPNLCDPCMGDCPGQVADMDAGIRKSQHSLDLIARATGGFAVVNTDDFTSGIHRIVDDLDHYYMLGFYPVDPSGKGYRSLDVKVNRPDATLRFRHGYDPSGPPPPPKNADPLVALSAGVMPKTDLPLRLTAIALPPVRNAAVPSSEKTARVVAALEVTAPTHSLVEGDAKLRDDISYEVLVIDDKKSKVTSRTGLAARMVLHGREGAGEMPDFLVYQVETTLDLPPGRYDLRASALSTKLGSGGSVYLTVDVPDFSAAPLMISGLAVGYADGAHAPVGRTAAPPHVLPFDVALDREFTTLDTLRLYCELSRANPAIPALVTIDLVDATDNVVMTMPGKLTAADSGHIDRELRLTDVAPGAYRLRVTATAGSQTSQREIGVIVR